LESNFVESCLFPSPALKLKWYSVRLRFALFFCYTTIPIPLAIPIYFLIYSQFSSRHRVTQLVVTSQLEKCLSLSILYLSLHFFYTYSEPFSFISWRFCGWSWGLRNGQSLRGMTPLRLRNYYLWQSSKGNVTVRKGYPIHPGLDKER
jgi:hypothetical protein